jgi:hypothetical protein
MTGTPPGEPGRDELTVRIFRALYTDFDLRTVHGLHIAVPRGTPWFASSSLNTGLAATASAIAWACSLRTASCGPRCGWPPPR